MGSVHRGRSKCACDESRHKKLPQEQEGQAGACVHEAAAARHAGRCANCSHPPRHPVPSPCCQVVEFPDASGPLEFSYDEEWLAILKATHSLMNLQRRPWPMPAAAPAPSEAEVEDVRRRLQQRGGYLGGWVRGCRVGMEDLA